MPGVFLSVDIGTTSLKAAFIDFDGRQKAFSRITYLRDSSGNVSASGWEAAFARAMESLNEQAPYAAIDAICVSGNGPTLVPVTHDGEVLPPLHWHDSRVFFPQSNQRTQGAFYEPPSFFLPRAAWLKENSPELYKRVKLFLSSHEWLASRLGAESMTVLPSASYERYYWDDAQFFAYDLDREKFPRFIKMGSVMGRVSVEAARFCGELSGLKEGTPIVAGGPDFITALIGTGIQKAGQVCDRAGSSEGINVCAADLTEKCVKPGGLRQLPHALEGLWNISALIPSSGRLFEQYRAYASFEDKPYERLLEELIPSCEIDLFKGAFFFPAKGFPPGEPIPLGEKITLGRAVLCAIGFAVRSAIESLADSNFMVSEMRVSGGQGKNERWNRLKADITGVSLLLPEIPDGELAGNAVLAASALEKTHIDTAADFESAVNRMIRFSEVYEPGGESASFWEERYKLYKQLCKNQMPLSGEAPKHTLLENQS